MSVGCHCGGYVYDGICIDCGNDVGDGCDASSDRYLERLSAESAAISKEEREAMRAEVADEYERDWDPPW